METQEQLKWLNDELTQLEAEKPQQTERKKSFKIEEGQTATFTVDFSTKFNDWPDPDNNTIKAIIPIRHNGEEMDFWLNKKNPLYKELIRKGRQGVTTFKILRTGQKKGTRYHLIE